MFSNSQFKGICLVLALMIAYYGIALFNLSNCFGYEERNVRMEDLTRTAPPRAVASKPPVSLPAKPQPALEMVKPLQTQPGKSAQSAVKPARRSGGFSYCIDSSETLQPKCKSGKGKVSLQFKIDINRAPVSELVNLNGIGEKLAERIIDFRNSNGLFSCIEELLNVPGIGAKKFDKIKDSITVEGGRS